MVPHNLLDRILNPSVKTKRKRKKSSGKNEIKITAAKG